jgi:hypothetical protein
MSEALSILAFLAFIVGMAALVLFLVDKFTLRPEMPKDDRKAAVKARTLRWRRRYLALTFIMAFIALFVHAFNLVGDSIPRRVTYFVLAALFVFWYISRKGEKADD